MQPHLIIHAQQAAFADVGHTADALRALADELENMDGGGGGWQQQPLLMNGRMVLPRQRRQPKLGSHWPAPLVIGFDIDDVRDELGIEVRGGPSVLKCELHKASTCTLGDKSLGLV